MSLPNLTLSAESPTDLFAQLRATDITVPLVTEGRQKEHREQYMMARFLSTSAGAGRLAFPLDVLHGDRPDFVLRFGGREVGVECVEAVPKESYEIEVIREKHYPDAMNFGQRFKVGDSNFTRNEKHEIASGKHAGYPWMPESAKRNWIAAMEHVVGRKTTKLRGGNYSSSDVAWLLVQDEWPTSLRFYPQQVRQAAAELARRLVSRFSAPSFRAVFIASGSQLLCLESGRLTVEEVRDLWQ